MKSNVVSRTEENVLDYRRATEKLNKIFLEGKAKFKPVRMPEFFSQSLERGHRHPFHGLTISVKVIGIYLVSFVKPFLTQLHQES